MLFLPRIPRISTKNSENSFNSWLNLFGGEDSTFYCGATCLRRTPIIVTRVPAIVSVNHGAGETPSAGLWQVRACEGVEGDAGRGDRERSRMKWLGSQLSTNGIRMLEPPRLHSSIREKLALSLSKGSWMVLDRMK